MTRLERIPKEWLLSEDVIGGTRGKATHNTDASYDFFRKQLQSKYDQLCREKILDIYYAGDGLEYSYRFLPTGIANQSVSDNFFALFGFRPEASLYYFLKVKPNERTILMWGCRPKPEETTMLLPHDGLWFLATPLDILRVTNMILEYEILVMDRKESRTYVKDKK